MAPAASHLLATYVVGTKAWFPDKDNGWISATLAKPVAKSATGEVTHEFTLDETGATKKVTTTEAKLAGTNGEDELPPLRNPLLLEATDDLTNLSYLNEPAVLHTILNRYSQRLMYTYSGIVLIAVNPFYGLSLYSPEIIQAYSGKRKGELEPHLFAIAEDAYRCMIRDVKDQTIVVSGESGAGKMVSAKYIMRYFATVEDPDRPGSRKAGAGGKDASGMSETEQQILATNLIMEAFGNAKTTRNDNSSRFGKYIEIQFEKDHEIVGAKMRTYLLERSRLVYQSETERNYHIFYQLCAGAPSSEKKDLGLEDASKFNYLNHGGTTSLSINGVDDAEEFKATQKALSIVGVKIEKQWQIFRLLAALLHLGNVNITASRNEAMLADDEPSLFMATSMLGIDNTEFRKWTVKKQLVTRGEKVVTNLSQAQALVVRVSVAKYVYTCLFVWLVDQMNTSLALGSSSTRESMIGVLDIYGFERFKVNSYEQFCINYANERLQHEFNHHVFKLEQEEYLQEQISWTFIDFLLASDILSSTIVEKDKYQIGLTKIFFRAEALPADAASSIKIQSWWRMQLAIRYVSDLRKATAATTIQTACRGFLARRKYLATRQAVITIQSLVRGRAVRATYKTAKVDFAATRLQSMLRGALVRMQYRNERRGIIHLQSCYRRRLAKKELVALRNEAKSVSHFKEVSYKLENKVAELTQNLQKRVKDNKELASKFRALEAQILTWQGRYDELDTKARNLQNAVDKPTVALAEFEALLAAKKELDAKKEGALKRIAEQEKRIAELSAEIERQAEELQARVEALKGATKTSEEDLATMASLRSEVASLREQLNRANALNTLQKNSQRIDNAAPPVFNMATGKENGYASTGTKRRPCRHSEAGPWSDTPMGTKDEHEEAMLAAKRSAANANRHLSVAFGADGQIPGFGQRSGGYDEDYDEDDPSEEIIRILENEEQLDEDELNGLIRYLKVPAPSLQNPPSPKEVLFPAHLISLVTNEMWKYMVRESERFLANVMQTIQQHVMSFTGDDAIIPGIFWFSNVHEILSFVCIAESDMLQGIGPGVDGAARSFEWGDYERLVTIVKHDLDSLEYNIYRTWMQEAKRKLYKMVIPALIKNQSLPGFVMSKNKKEKEGIEQETSTEPREGTSALARQ
ncbi:Myosin type-2 heavy chain 1 [Thecaphora frezii]